MVPKQPVVAKPKTPEDIANEKRAKAAEEKAELHRQKKKQGIFQIDSTFLIVDSLLIFFS